MAMEILGPIWLFIRKLVYEFISGTIFTVNAELYDLMIRIARAKVFTSGTIYEISGRVYQLLALIMMFRLIFIFMTYIINPDDLTDKKKGYSGIIKKVIITLGLIIVTPWAFTQARNIQTVVLDDGVIEYFILGQDSNTYASSGYELMYTIGKMFVTPYQCDGQCTAYAEEANKCEDAKWVENVPPIDSRTGTLTCTDCRGTCGYGAGEDPAFAKALYRAQYSNGAKYDLGALMSLGSYGKVINGELRYYVDIKYGPLMPILAIAIGYMLLVICIDVAVRSIKLSFYEMIAPVPIISYIGPKDGKDSMLNKWFNQVTKTYLDLFIRIGGLELAVFFIDTMLKNGIAENDFFVGLFLIIGALTFAKKLPEILKDLGINLDTGGFDIRKKPGVSAIGGLAAGAVGGMLGNYRGSREAGRNVFQSLASGALGALPGSLRGGAAGFKDKDGAGFQKGFAAAGKGGQRIVKNAGSSFGGRTMAGVQQKLGLSTRYDEMKKEFDNQDEWQKVRKGMEEYAMGEINKDSGFTASTVSWTDALGGTHTGNVNLAMERARLQRMQSDPTTAAADIVAQQNMLAAAEKKAKEQWIDANVNDAQIAASYAQLNGLEKKLNMNTSRRYSDISANKKAIETDVGRRYGDEYKRAKANAEASKPKK